MKASKTYLKGKSVFIVSLIVIGITSLTVYLTGINFSRTVTSNLYISLGIIGTCLFLFMGFGLYKGVGLIDNFPNFKNFKTGDFISQSGEFPEIAMIDVADGLEGILLSILFWIVMTIVTFILMIMLEAIFWFSLFIILMMLYWVFFRALKLVFKKSKETKGNIGQSLLYSLGYTMLYTGWLFAITYAIETFRSFPNSSMI